MALCSPQCHICSVGGPVTCVDCDAPVGCHIQPSPYLCHLCLQKPEKKRQDPAPIVPDHTPWTGSLAFKPPMDWPVGRKTYLTVADHFKAVQDIARSLLATPEETRDRLIDMLEKTEKRLNYQTALLQEAQRSDFRRTWEMTAGQDIDDWINAHRAAIHGDPYYRPFSLRFRMVKGRIDDVLCACGASFQRGTR